MQNIKLLMLSVSNFKGLKAFTFEPNGESCAIYGANGLGKSSLLIAFQSLLGYGNSEQTMKDGVVIPGINCVVSGELLVDGEKLSLTKTMREKRNKKGELTGNEYIYTVGSDTVSATEYENVLNGFAGSSDALKAVTATNYLDGINWALLREMVIRIAQDGVDDIEIAEKVFAVPEYKDFAALVSDGKPAQYRMEKLKERKSPLDKKISEKNGEIRGAKSLLPDANSTIPPAGNYADLKAGLISLQNQRAALLAGDTSEIKSQIMAIQGEIQKIGGEYRDKLRLSEDEKRKFTDAGRKIEQNIITERDNLSRIRRQIDEAEKSRLAQIDLWYKNNNLPEPADTCNFCEQPLPEEKIATLRAKFRLDKAERLKSITETGLKYKAEKESFEATAAEIELSLKTLSDDLQLAKEASEAVELPPAPDYSLKQEAIYKLERDMETVATPDTSRIDQMIAESEMLIEKHDEASRNLKIAAEGDKKVAEMQKDLKALVVELEGVEKGIFLLAEFAAKKVEFLTAAINKKFAPLKFKIVNYLAGGGSKDCCEVMGFSDTAGTYVPLSKLSKGQMAIVKVEFMSKMQSYYGISAPAFIDDCDGITIPIPVMEGSQYIMLVADKAYDELTVMEVTA